MKKIINSPQNVVTEMLEGIRIANPQLALDSENNVIYRKEVTNKVGLVSGGGSGHEPAHAGYVGYGMLDAAVSGNVFASPDPYKVFSGIKHANHNKGVLLIIKNYSGDVMNFDMATELAKEENIEVRQVIVNDDVSIKDKESRRGIVGTIFVHKIAGAAAEQGRTLDEVEAIANKVIRNVRSIGFSLTSCTIPEVGYPIFDINEDEIELGMGIHGEPGVTRTRLLSSKELSNYLVSEISNDDLDYTNEEVAVIVNGLGSTTLMELNILLKDVNELLISKSITPVRFFVGNFMTSLEMAGATLSILKLDNELKQYLDATCSTPALKVGV
jgi:dihydroxyacetone kinase-like protein